MQLRAEKVTDYAEIGAVHLRAFGQRVGDIVALLRQRPEFDPELSLVAEIDGRVIGHILFSPYRVRLMGEEFRAVNLSPLGIDPAYQKQGIGGKLIEAGHEIAREKGCSLSIVLGHPPYYPRFGYLTQAYGASNLTLSVADLPAFELTARALTEEDIPALHALWRQMEGAVDLALDPGQEMLAWLSPNPAIKTIVFTGANGEVAGYSRTNSAEPHKPHYFLAKDSTSARQIAAHLAQLGGASEVVLPVHPASPFVAELGTATSTAWDAGMVYPLVPCPQFDEYYSQVKAGNRAPGRPIWPTAFDLN